MPWAAFVLVRQSIEGFVPPIAAGAWSGWRFGADGRLYAPDIKRGYEPHHIRQLDILLPMYSWSKELRGLVKSHLDKLAAHSVAATGKVESRGERSRQV